jgi:hypothetical protein
MSRTALLQERRMLRFRDVPSRREASELPAFAASELFVRYIPWLAARAGRVTLRVHQELVDLLRANLSGATVLGDRGDVGPHDCAQSPRSAALSPRSSRAMGASTKADHRRAAPVGQRL